uniref:Uncharacterized protein n=1 Tax=Physcomitrium patens TaxID=3218 RepID=A0A2K1JTM1_PHYPA|nr:hypothetical protein PHYPA_014654 [Physcomitrium patens]
MNVGLVWIFLNSSCCKTSSHGSSFRVPPRSDSCCKIASLRAFVIKIIAYITIVTDIDRFLDEELPLRPRRRLTCASRSTTAALPSLRLSVKLRRKRKKKKKKLKKELNGI